MKKGVFEGCLAGWAPGGPSLSSRLMRPRLVHASAVHSEGEGAISGSQCSWQSPGLWAPRGDKAALSCLSMRVCVLGVGAGCSQPLFPLLPPPLPPTPCKTSWAGHWGRGGPAQGKVRPCPSRVGPCAWAPGDGTRIGASGVRDTDWAQAGGGGGPRAPPGLPGRGVRRPAVATVARAGGATVEPGAGAQGSTGLGEGCPAPEHGLGGRRRWVAPWAGRGAWGGRVTAARALVPPSQEAGEETEPGGGLGPAAAPAGRLRPALPAPGCRARPRPSPAMRPPGLCGAAPLAAAALLVLGAPLGKGVGSEAAGWARGSPVCCRSAGSGWGPSREAGPWEADPGRGVSPGGRPRGFRGGAPQGGDEGQLPRPGSRRLGASGSGAKGGRKAGLVAMGPPPHLPAALAGEDCLWYLDRNGSWHPGFNCEFFTFCCGTCYQRYCCRDLTLLITERQQKHCLAFRWAPASTQPPSILLSGGLPGPPPLLPVSLLPLSMSTSTALAQTWDSAW